MDIQPTPIGDLLTSDFVHHWQQFTEIESPSTLTFLCESALRTKRLENLLRSGNLNSDHFHAVAREFQLAQQLRIKFEHSQFAHS